RLLYHCQDLYPELGAHSGFWKADGMIDRLLRRIERKTRTRADVLVALSHDMAATVHNLAEPQGTLAVVNNFMLEDFSGEAATALLQPAKHTENERLQLIFAGNLGQFQGLDLLVDAMRLVGAKRNDVELVFMGEGKAAASLKVQAQGLSNVVFKGHQPFEEAQIAIAAADIGIVSLEPEIYRLAFPSKTLTYLGLGMPLFCVIEENSELARMVSDNGIGAVAPRDPQAIADAIIALADTRKDLPTMRERASSWFASRLDRPAVLDHWSGMIGELNEPRNG
ncbi:MAG: glycosyltransferase, partial [Marinomonas sp.]